MRHITSVSALAMLCYVCFSFSVEASPSTTLNVGAEIEMPVSVVCNTNIDAGDAALGDSSILSDANAANRSWVVGTKASLNASATGLSLVSRAPGSCKVSGLSENDILSVSFESNTVDLISNDTTVVLQATPKLVDPDDAAAQVASATVVVNTSGDVEVGGDGYSVSLPSYDVSFPVGVEIEIPQSTAALDVVGEYSGTATVVVGL